MTGLLSNTNTNNTFNSKRFKAKDTRRPLNIMWYNKSSSSPFGAWVYRQPIHTITETIIWTTCSSITTIIRSRSYTANNTHAHTHIHTQTNCEYSLNTNCSLFTSQTATSL
jgi:hypothetical protein